ncbi:MAG: hypothetical protein WC821_03080 [archaeon]|jgi:hypothetical protein
MKMIDSSPAKHFQIDYKSSKEIYSMDFDLFKLAYFENINKVVYFKGTKCRELFTELITEVCTKKNCLRQHLAKELSGTYNSNLSTMQYFISSKEYFPIYLTSKIISKLSEERQEYYKNAFNKSVEYFKCGTSKEWTIFPKKLSAELAWLCGAIAADGWITKESFSGYERIGIADFHKKALLKASLFFMKCFGHEPVVKRHNKLQCWQIVFRSKAITQFFTTYLGFHYGVKVYDICEPKILKNSKYRLDYASGVMSFDGSVAMDGVVSLGCASEKLAQDIHTILLENGLKTRLTKKKSEKQNLFFVKSEGLLHNVDSSKWISLFGVDIEKGQRLDALVNGFKDTPLSEQDALLRLKHFVNYPSKNECPIYRIFFVLKNKSSIKRQDLLKLTKLPHVTFYKYVWVLRKANIVSCYTGQFWRGFENTYKFNYNIEEWRVPSL